ncbi:MAG TPA: hypothetical protein VFN30_11360 [Chitinophagaceae bacterium]|nr:hypothetical protein [Chitinophagaceae bacterium]
MNKNNFLLKLSFLITPVCISSVLLSQKTVSGLIEAEKAFAKYALDFNTRDAFVKYFDTANIALNEGKALNGYQAWVKRKKRSSKLLWQPEFAAIASSGEYGVTTGPYEFKASLNDTALDRGHFTSIWFFNSDGEWKNLLDHGSGYSHSYPAVSNIKSVSLQKSKSKKNSGQSMEMSELNFIKQYETEGKKAYNKIVSKHIWFNTNGYQPVSGFDKLNKALEVIDNGIHFAPIGFKTSKSKDFGFVYGTITRNEKTANYVRVWIKENGSWKLLLQVLD